MTNEAGAGPVGLWLGDRRRTPGLTLHSHGGTSFRFDPGALCLELLLTGGPGWLARFEVLHEPADLARWAVLSRLPDGLDLTVDEDELAAARTVRDALHAIAADRAHGRTPDPARLAQVSAAAAVPPLGVRFTPDGGRAWASGATGGQLLSTVARDAVELFGGPHGDRVRECATDNCALLFVDTSRPGRRRWCSMERCGNRHKVRTHRARPADPDAGT
ncbi:CGNR zinc finger domain-containing protein [Streptomyces uncialis]|uniref:CGNR zinc finger domain-containing protein n=1 Tax=Streptomyces uncialis TaxID=1048205 RepID=UPI0038653767|nr:CGNR zinc finger domain-containing protein [Streptomyces uncialis]